MKLNENMDDDFKQEYKHDIFKQTCFTTKRCQNDDEENHSNDMTE